MTEREREREMNGRKWMRGGEIHRNTLKALVLFVNSIQFIFESCFCHFRQLFLLSLVMWKLPHFKHKIKTCPDLYVCISTFMYAFPGNNFFRRSVRTIEFAVVNICNAQQSAKYNWNSRWMNQSLVIFLEGFKYMKWLLKTIFIKCVRNWLVYSVKIAKALT